MYELYMYELYMYELYMYELYMYTYMYMYMDAYMYMYTYMDAWLDTNKIISSCSNCHKLLSLSCVLQFVKFHAINYGSSPR